MARGRIPCPHVQPARTGVPVAPGGQSAGTVSYVPQLARWPVAAHPGGHKSPPPPGAFSCVMAKSGLTAKGTLEEESNGGIL